MLWHLGMACLSPHYLPSALYCWLTAFCITWISSAISCWMTAKKWPVFLVVHSLKKCPPIAELEYMHF